MLWEPLDDPPSPDELRAWSRARRWGRRWFIARGMIGITIFFGIPSWLAGKVLAFLIIGKEFDFSSGFELWPVWPLIAWMNLPGQWTKNEALFAKYDGQSGKCNF